MSAKQKVFTKWIYTGYDDESWEGSKKEYITQLKSFEKEINTFLSQHSNSKIINVYPASHEMGVSYFVVVEYSE